MGILHLNGIEVTCVFNGIHVIHLLIYKSEKIENSDEFMNLLKSTWKMFEFQSQEVIENYKKVGITILDKERVKNKIYSPGHYIHFNKIFFYLAQINQCSHLKVVEYYRSLGFHIPDYITSWLPDALQVIKLAVSLGCKPVLAHPALYNIFKQVDFKNMIEQMADAGLKGLEINHFANSAYDRIRLKKIAYDYSLHITGGSDFHGNNIGRLKGHTPLGENGISLKSFKKFIAS